MKNLLTLLVLVVSAQSFASGSVGSATDKTNALKIARSQYKVQFQPTNDSDLGLSKMFVKKFVESSGRFGLRIPSKQLAPLAFYDKAEPGVSVSIVTNQNVSAPKILDGAETSTLVIGSSAQIPAAVEKLQIYLLRSYGYQFSTKCPIRKWYGCVDQN